MSKTPISLLIDDGAPRVSVYWHHAKSRFTSKGNPLVSDIPNEFLYEFHDVVKQLGGVVNQQSKYNPSVSYADSSLYTREPLMCGIQII